MIGPKQIFLNVLSPQANQDWVRFIPDEEIEALLYQLSTYIDHLFECAKAAFDSGYTDAYYLLGQRLLSHGQSQPAMNAFQLVPAHCQYYHFAQEELADDYANQIQMEDYSIKLKLSLKHTLKLNNGVRRELLIANIAAKLLSFSDLPLENNLIDQSQIIDKLNQCQTDQEIDNAFNEIEAMTTPPAPVLNSFDHQKKASASRRLPSAKASERSSYNLRERKGARSGNTKQ